MKQMPEKKIDFFKSILLIQIKSVQWPAKKVSHHLNVSVKKALITHLDFDVTQK
jgi:hypothetical protein